MSFDDLDPERLRTSRTGEKWHEFADDVLPAWVADMDFAVAEPIQRSLLRMIRDSDLAYFSACARNAAWSCAMRPSGP